jgi:hypothetical protein
MVNQSTPEGTQNLSASHRTWFDQMTGYLKWKVLGPDINNPFMKPIALHTLNRMAANRDYLNQHIQVRCMCDGYEVMMISNPSQPKIISNHPCITGMDRSAIVEYIRRVALDDFIDQEIDRIEEEIRNHLRDRAKEKDETTEFLTAAKRAKASTPGIQKPEKEKSGSQNFRIVKR